MSRRAFGIVLAALVFFCGAGNVRAEDGGRSLPFNKQNVFNYFQRVDSAKRQLPDKMKPGEYEERVCRLYADTLRQGGYDFEHTVQNAVQFGEKGLAKLDDPRFLFLAGVFQIHPKVYLRLKFISKATYDDVMHYFGQ
jgi:hypothetical protein